VLRELQNRRRGGALMARFADDTARLSSALAARLARIPVRWLHAGDPLDAAAAIDRFFRDL
jgi:hypothetical protein